MNGIRGHGGQSGKGRPWAHGSSLGACVPICSGGSDDQEPIWGLVLYVFSEMQLTLNGLDPTDISTVSSSSDVLQPDPGPCKNILWPHNKKNAALTSMAYDF